MPVIKTPAGWLRALAALMLLGLLGACATVPPPTDLMDKAQTAIQQASEGAAEQNAPLELKFAREKYAAAQSAIQKEDYKEARQLAQEAIANAELSSAKSAAADARAAAREARDEVEALRKELEQAKEGQ